jgi:hypothetical protein
MVDVRAQARGGATDGMEWISAIQYEQANFLHTSTLSSVISPLVMSRGFNFLLILTHFGSHPRQTIACHTG